jgi:Fe(3+) dicitrate transport protein
MNKAAIFALALLALSTARAASAQDVSPDPELELESVAPEGLEPEAVLPEDLELDPLTIEVSTDDAFRTAGSVTLLDEEQLRRFNYVDPQSIVTQAPGVYVRSEDGYGLRPNIGIRGANSDRSKKITLMEDGVLFAPAPYSAPAGYYFPIMSRIAGVDVFKGPAAIMFGPSTIGGAIDFRTHDIPVDPGGRIELTLGNNTFGNFNAHYGAQNRWGGYFLEVAHVQSAGFKTVDYRPTDDTGFSRTDIVGRLRAQTNPDAYVAHRFDLKLVFGRETSNETYVGLSDADFRADPYRRYVSSAEDHMHWWRTQVVLSHRLNVGDVLEMRTDVYRSDQHRVWRKVNRFPTYDIGTILADPTAGARRIYYDILTGATDSDTSNPSEAILLGTNDRTYLSEGIQSNARIRFETGELRHDIRAGVRLHYDEARRYHTEDPFWMIQRALVSTGDPTTVTTNDVTNALALAGHVAYGLNWRALTVTPGLRIEHVWGRNRTFATGQTLRNTQLAFQPGVGAQVAIVEDVTAFAGVYRGTSPVAPGQPGVLPESSVNYELGARFRRPDSNTLLEMTGFFNDYSNLTGECGFSAGCIEIDRQFNAGRVFIYGLEAMATHTFRIGASLELPLRAAYTFTQSEFRSSFTSDNPQFGVVTKGDELPYVPTHQVALQAGIEEPREWQANVSATVVSRMREAAGQGDEGMFTDTQVMIDVAGRYRVFEGMDLTLRGENLAFQDPIGSRRPFGARPIRPFQIQVGFSYEL